MRQRIPPAIQSKLQKALDFHRAGQHGKAERAARRILDDHPRHAELLEFTAMLCNEQAKYADAASLCRRALAETPNSPVGHHIMGCALLGLNQPEEALVSLRTADRLQPRQPDTLISMGAALTELNRLDDAVVALRAALASAPGASRAHFGLGVALFGLWRYQEAIESFQAAGRLGFPVPAEVHARVGRSLARLERHEAAVEAFEASLRLRPGHMQTLTGAAHSNRSLGRYDRAIASLEQALAFEPGNGEAALLLLHLRQHIGDWRDYENTLRGVLERLPDAACTDGPGPLLSLIDDAALLHTCASAYAKAVGEAASPVLARRPPAGRAKIRIGYLSGDFRVHPVSALTAGLFEAHDRQRFEVHAFSSGPDDGSAMRTRLRCAFDQFHDIANQRPAQVAADINAREIDILVDLMGYTQGNLGGVLAARPAPIQVGYLGYPGTVGGPWLDYIVADPVVVPLEQAACFSEKLVHLPECFQVNDDKRAPVLAVPPRSAHALPDGAFVFSCFNGTIKITPEIFTAWMNILRAVPDSVLWLAARQPGVAENLRREAAACGIDGERLIFALPEPSYDAHIARLACADLFLDTYPYTAHTTGSDALWAGVPLVTYAGATYASRVAASLLGAIRLPELIAHSLAEYEALAVRLGSDRTQYQALRERTARNRNASTLFDTARFCRHLEDAFECMLALWLAGQPPRHLAVPARPA